MDNIEDGEAIVLKKRFGENEIIVTELKILFFYKNILVWTHHFHTDIIVDAILHPDFIEIIEWNGSRSYGIGFTNGTIIYEYEKKSE